MKETPPPNKVITFTSVQGNHQNLHDFGNSLNSIIEDAQDDWQVVPNSTRLYPVFRNDGTLVVMVIFEVETEWQDED